MDVDTSDYVLVSSRALSGEKPETIHSPASEYQKHLNSHVSGTGQWILDTDQYRRWFEGGDQGALWIRGIPGSGKSVVAASLVRKLQAQAECPVLFFFFREIIMSNRTPQALLRDFARGLLPRCPSLQSDLRLLMEEHPEVEPVPFDKLWRCVSSGLAVMPKVYCVVDALDEMENGHDNFIGTLIDIANQHPGSIKLILTSRQLLFLENHFKGTSGLIDLRLDRQNVDSDIATYITYRLNASQPPVSPGNASAIKEAICSKGKGLFLYARLMMEQLLAQPQDIMSQLADLPDGLGNMYTDILRESAVRSGTNRHFQLLVLQWITHSVRPLRLLELATAIECLPDRGGLGPDQDAKASVQSSCGPLLELCEDGVLQIIHHSLTEFLRDPELSHARRLGPQAGMQSIDSSVIHGHIASTCIDYILTVCASSSNATAKEDDSQYDESFPGKQKETFRRFPFLRYAAKFWPSHASRAHASRATDANQTLFAKMEKILSPEKGEFEFWKGAFLDRHHQVVDYSTRPLHLAAFYGLDGYIEKVIPHGTDVNMADVSGRTPLVYAAMQNQANVVRTLLRYGARHDIADNSGMTPLHYAAQNNHVESLRVLLEGGADPLAAKSKENDRFNPRWNESTIGETALVYACRYGHVETLLELQKYVQSHNFRNGPIHWAAEADPQVKSAINDRNVDGNTPLYLAAYKYQNAHMSSCDTRSRRNSERTVPTRLRTTKPQRCYTPLHGWAHLSGFDSHPKVVRLLVAAGCNVNARDHSGRTALFVLKDIKNYRSKENYRAVAIISVLFTHGADASVVDHEGHSVLHLLDNRIVTESVLRLLIEAGSDINAKRKADERTLLMIQTVDRFSDLDLKPFHMFGADFDAQDADGNTAAHLAAQGAMRYSRHAQSWVTIANPNLRNNTGQTVLHSLLCGSRVDDPELISSMMEKGFSLESQDYRGRTALLTFLDGQRWSDSSEVLLRSLLGLGANPRATDYQGKSALHLIAASVVSFIDAGRADVKKKKDWMKQLLDAGADLHAVDHAGNTVLHDSMMWRESWRMAQSSVHAAVELGIPTQACNYQGRNILHLAALTDDGVKSNKRDGKDAMATRLGFALQAHIGLDINGSDYEGITPLHLAAIVSEQNTKRLVRSGADVRRRTYSGETSLHYAAKACQSNIVGYLLELYQGDMSLVNAQSLAGRTALHEAARSGRHESVKLLLDAGADPTVGDARGRSALHAAGEFDARISYSSEGSRPEEGNTKKNSLQQMGVIIETEDGSRNIREVVRLLRNAGADPAQLDNDEYTPTEVALMHGIPALVEELAPTMKALYSRSDEDSLSPVDPLGEFLCSSSPSTLRWVDDFPVPQNHRQLLERAISTGNELLVENLVRSKRLRLIEDDGTSALCFAARWGCVSMMRRLVPYASDLNSCSPPLLIVAAKRRLPNTEMIKLLIECGVDPNAQDVDEKYLHGVTATHILARGEHWWNAGGLAFLLDAGGDTEVKTLDGKTPLHIALETGESQDSLGRVWSGRTLEVLVRHGADVNATTSEGVTPLHTALSRKKDGDTLRLLLSSGADPSLGDPPAIFSALRAYDPSALKILLQAGIDPNLVHKPHGTKRQPKKVEEQTPLELAASPFRTIQLHWTDIIAAHEECVSLLLDHGANPNLPLCNGLSTPLHEICSLNGLIKPIIQGGFDLEQRDADGRTPLHRACIRSCGYHFDLSIAKEYASLQLVDSGVNVHATDDTGSTALHYAAQYGMVSTVKALLQALASPTVKNHAGFTPFYYALLNPRCDIINALLDAGANPLERGPDGRTALHFIAPCLMEYDYTKRPTKSLWDDEEEDEDEDNDENEDNLTRFGRLYRRLVASGCDRFARDKDGNTPLFAYVATVKVYHEDVETPLPPTAADMNALFAEHDVQARNNKGETLLHVVAQRDDLDNALVDAPVIFTALVERGLSPWTEDEQGATALDVAAAFEQDEILALYARDE
ncbi:ankyrin repeat-containing domain protein [Aspergillus taichungensis]|uniref:Ankyrin repeat-containing domain protein n=1 Tax=Aspergillus taichungensis TaxID=482145 RepID=A0A2J5I1H0_9EURO|nr:ankyrin repeat-containing domain protein [Aspergillus taichungensis]